LERGRNYATGNVDRTFCPKLIESEKGKERKLSQLLLKYGDLNLVQGIFTVFVAKNSSTNQKRAK
jgi:low temperature requirement protein LtrA